MQELRGKVIWITGASSGIGESLAYALAKKGAKIILSARREDELERVKRNCGESVQVDVHVLPLDLSKPETLKLCTETAIQILGKIDVLIRVCL